MAARPALLALAIAAATLLPATTGEAETARSLDSSYSVSFLRLPVGRVDADVKLDGDAFSVNTSFSSAGLLRIFESMHGTMQARGKLAAGRVRPDRFHINYVEGDDSGATTVTFRGGNVADVKLVPKPNPDKPKDYVAIRPDDLKSVADPLSALFLAPGNQGEICRRTLRLFDGETRADLVLSPGPIGPVVGYSGDAVTCNAGFVPVSGYRRSDDTYEYLRRRGRISLQYVPVPDAGAYTLLRLEVHTSMGTIRLDASRIKIE